MRNSVYSASERILGLSLVKTGRLPLLEPVTISGSMVNGLNVTFSFKLGDGSETLEPSEQSQIRHIYDQPGSYVVSMEATNPITGSITVSEVGMLKVIYQTGSRDCAVVRVLASYQRGLGSIPARCYMWVEFVVGSHPCSEGFSLGSLVFLTPQKTNTPNSNSIWKQWTKSLSVGYAAANSYLFYFFIFFFKYVRLCLSTFPNTEKIFGSLGCLIYLLNRNSN